MCIRDSYHTWAWKVPRSSRLVLVPVMVEPDGSPVELGQAVREGVTSFKAYMAYENLRLNDKELLELFKATADIGVVGCLLYTSRCV